MGKKEEKKRTGGGRKQREAARLLYQIPQMFFFNFFEHLKVTFEKLNHFLGAQVSCHNIIHSFLMTLTSYSIRIQLHKLGKAASSFLSLSLRFLGPDPFYLQGDNFFHRYHLFSHQCVML